MNPEIYLFCDLDRTVLPNGEAPTSPDAMDRFRRLAARDEVFLGYVSGRDRVLLEAAITEYALPVPDVAVGDVGTTIYHPHDGWVRNEAWWEEIADDWKGRSREELAESLQGLEGLVPQAEEKQGRFKLSYDTATDDLEAAAERVRARLEKQGIRFALITSIDEEKDCGLLDILPERATKVDAVRFVLRTSQVDEDAAVFAGDSGNDLPALTSGLRAVLVGNAATAVREASSRQLRERGVEPSRLYFARGGFLGMNGNYTAGVLEGLAHFFPCTAGWMKA